MKTKYIRSKEKNYGLVWCESANSRKYINEQSNLKWSWVCAMAVIIKILCNMIYQDNKGS